MGASNFWGPLLLLTSHFLRCLSHFSLLTLYGPPGIFVGAT